MDPGTQPSLSASALERFYPNDLKDTVPGQPLHQDGDIKPEFLEKLSNSVHVLTEELRHLPASDNTVYTGCAGQAYLHLESYLITKDQAQLLMVRKPLERSLRGLRSRRVSFLCGDAGPLALACVFYDIVKDEEERNNAARVWGSENARQLHFGTDSLV